MYSDETLAAIEKLNRWVEQTPFHQFAIRGHIFSDKDVSFFIRVQIQSYIKYRSAKDGEYCEEVLETLRNSHKVEVPQKGQSNGTYIICREDGEAQYVVKPIKRVLES